ncbi:MAG: TatD family hydrolase, partial [Planctomycetota bacterium]
GVITIASDLADSFKTVALAREHAMVWATVGVHPHEAAKTKEDDLPKLAGLAAEPRVVAWGEIGLDYHYDLSDRSSQLDAFSRQLELASGIGLPLVIHCREALDDTERLLAESGFHGRPVVFHCFSGNGSEAEVIASHGWRISFTGLVTYKSAREVQAVAREYPADMLMIETDSPYLSPVPMRGKSPNEPAHLIHTARFLADLRGEDLDDLIEQTAANTREFFGLAK